MQIHWGSSLVGQFDVITSTWFAYETSFLRFIWKLKIILNKYLLLSAQPREINPFVRWDSIYRSGSKREKYTQEYFFLFNFNYYVTDDCFPTGRTKHKTDSFPVSSREVGRTIRENSRYLLCSALISTKVVFEMWNAVKKSAPISGWER